jgi:hypothetical protein
MGSLSLPLIGGGGGGGMGVGPGFAMFSITYLPIIIQNDIFNFGPIRVGIGYSHTQIRFGRR